MVVTVFCSGMSLCNCHRNFTNYLVKLAHCRTVSTRCNFQIEILQRGGVLRRVRGDRDSHKNEWTSCLASVSMWKQAEVELALFSLLKVCLLFEKRQHRCFMSVFFGSQSVFSVRKNKIYQCTRVMLKSKLEFSDINVWVCVQRRLFLNSCHFYSNFPHCSCLKSFIPVNYHIFT